MRPCAMASAYPASSVRRVRQCGAVGGKDHLSSGLGAGLADEAEKTSCHRGVQTVLQLFDDKEDPSLYRRVQCFDWIDVEPAVSCKQGHRNREKPQEAVTELAGGRSLTRAGPLLEDEHDVTQIRPGYGQGLNRMVGHQPHELVDATEFLRLSVGEKANRRRDVLPGSP
jgi:hypothetical protein